MEPMVIHLLLMSFNDLEVEVVFIITTKVANCAVTCRKLQLPAGQIHPIMVELHLTIVITGSTTITNSDGSSTTTYNFYDPATGNPNYGTSSNNTLTVNDGKLTGSFEKTNGRTNNYTVTSVRTIK